MIKGLDKVPSVSLDWAQFMESKSQKDRRDPGSSASGKPYRAPKLRHFGSVGALTQAGTVSTTEANMMGQGMNQL